MSLSSGPMSSPLGAPMSSPLSSSSSSAPSAGAAAVIVDAATTKGDRLSDAHVKSAVFIIQEYFTSHLVDEMFARLRDLSPPFASIAASMWSAVSAVTLKTVLGKNEERTMLPLALRALHKEGLLTSLQIELGLTDMLSNYSVSSHATHLLCMCTVQAWGMVCTDWRAQHALLLSCLKGGGTNTREGEEKRMTFFHLLSVH